MFSVIGSYFLFHFFFVSFFSLLLGFECLHKSYILVARLDVAVHHALLPLLMEISQRGAQAEDDLVPMYTIKSIRKRWTIYIIL